jgi:cation diffusion facilitator family transporter
MNITNTQREKRTKNVTILGAIVNLILAIIKIIVGMLGNSSALVADGIHSFSDLISDSIVYVAAHHSSKAPDEDHPYGHERFETVATLGLGLVLCIVGGYIIIDAILQFSAPKPLTHNTLLITIALLSIASKEFLYQVTLKVSKQINSKMLKANAWHHRLDAISSIIVLIGIVGGVMGYQYFDSIAAIIVGFMVIKIAWDLVKDSIKELVDTSIDSGEIKKLTQTLQHVEGVINIHSLRTRTNAHKIIADVHIQVGNYLSVSEGHRIGIMVEHTAKQYMNNITEVIVHIDPEDDEHCDYHYENLPSKTQILQELQDQIHQDIICKLLDIRVHYLQGGIHMECYFSTKCLDTYSKKEIYTKMQYSITNQQYIKNIDIYFA